MERRVLVTYESIPSELWARVEPDLTAQLPLRNLHWKPALRPLRTIQALNLDLKAFQSLADDQNAPKSTSILERPYLHLLFVSCEVSRSSGALSFWSLVATFSGSRTVSCNTQATSQAMARPSAGQAKSRMAHSACHYWQQGRPSCQVLSAQRLPA